MICALYQRKAKDGEPPDLRRVLVVGIADEDALWIGTGKYIALDTTKALADANEDPVTLELVLLDGTRLHIDQIRVASERSLRAFDPNAPRIVKP